MNRYCKILLLMFFTLLCVHTDSFGTEVTTLPLNRNAVFNYINDYRSYFGIEKLSLDDRLNKAADSHAVYLKTNTLLTIEEEKEKKGFTGTYPWNRASYYGFDSASVYEEVKKDSKNYRRIVMDIMSDPIKRAQFLSSEYEKIGIGIIADLYVFDFSKSKEGTLKDTLIEFPKSGSTITNLFLDAQKSNPTVSLTLYSRDDVREIQSVTGFIRNQKLGRNEQVTFSSQIVNKNKVVGSISTGKALSFNTEYTASISIIYVTASNIKKTVEKVWNFKIDIEANQDTLFTYKPIKSVKTVKNAKDHWAEDVINSFYTNDYIRVDANGNYSIDQPMNRIEFAEMIFRALELTSSGSKKSFIDVIGDEKQRYANEMYQYNIMQGVSDNEFSPNTNLTREEAAVIVVNILEKTTGKLIIAQDKQQIFTDLLDCQVWSRESVKKAASSGLMKGREDGIFYPKQVLTKAEAITLLYRLIRMV